MKKFALIKGWGLLWCLLIKTIYLLHSPTYAYPIHTTTLQIQQQPITGTVTDATNVPILGVNIIIKGKTKGTTTDIDGKYQLQAQPTDMLVFSYLGYQLVEEPLNGRTVINVQLQEDTTMLQQVVINAGYYTTTERERTGSISRITAKDIEKQPVSNPLASLQGRVAGVEIEQTSGLAGSNFNIKIRGRNSIRTAGNDPLYVIDGVPYSSSSLGERQASIILPGGSGVSPLNNINPSDIENIEILKDADATAIYGSRGANGVVLITTKKGKYGDTKVEFNILSGLGTVSNALDLLNTSEYLAMRREAFANDGIDPLPSYAYDINGTWEENRETDWQKTLYGKTSYLTNVQGSVSGGSGQTRFLVSGNYHKQTGVFPGNYHNDKISALANLSHRSKNDRLSLQLSTNYTSNQNNLPSDGLFVSKAISLAPNAPELYNDDGSLNWEGSTWANPLASLKKTYESNATTLVANARLGYNILENLKLTTNLGYTENHLKELRTDPSTAFDPAYGIGPGSSTAVHNTGQNISWIVEPQLHFNYDMGKTKMEALVGLSFQEQKSSQRSQFAFGFTSNSLIENLSAASNIFPLSDLQEQYRYQAAFGRINLNHKGKYLLNITGRRDGSSRFGTDKRFANFGAVGVAWIFSEETLIDQTFPFLSFGKLRGSYGTTGNDQIGDYQYLDTYSFGTAQYQNILGLYPTRLFNPDFSWETNRKLEFSLELGFVQDRIFISVNHYRNRSSNQLVGIPLPGTTGFSSINANLDATVENTGWELELNTVNIKTKDLEWISSFNLTIPKNKLLEFPDLEGSTYANQLVIGESLNIRKVYRLNGVNPQTGLYEFEDFNNDGIITSPDDKQVVKNFDPKYFGGFSNSIRYKKFSMDILLQFSKQLNWNFWYNGPPIVGSMSNQPSIVLQHWQEEGDIEPFQQFTTGANQEGVQAFRNYTESDAAISDASYLRLKTLSLAYQLYEKGTNGWGCQLFLRGQNLWTYTNYTGLDPETGNQTIPPLRFITMGTRLTF
ncbi:SusC/RagA family TonB-linked outer membrane protein [Galbibacter sp. EGI 63066]|uniref:SusC/RagA family TonB-linked outer membrane protein n=1 Tax=Galbibacter sp. EGI 63066 TaxID=2993559 RepID=UPI00224886A3|nr:SusC/RagA family TonB-linked outer membrane protein [Galbibacter sp. EGI 63066]MCX2680746.1 SusC/RagA family TonB-linked outer membrane protein [Galbibacter sp. EGI 63066]